MPLSARTTRRTSGSQQRATSRRAQATSQRQGVTQTRATSGSQQRSTSRRAQATSQRQGRGVRQGSGAQSRSISRRDKPPTSSFLAGGGQFTFPAVSSGQGSDVRQVRNPTFNLPPSSGLSPGASQRVRPGGVGPAAQGLVSPPATPFRTTVRDAIRLFNFNDPAPRFEGRLLDRPLDDSLLQPPLPGEKSFVRSDPRLSQTQEDVILAAIDQGLVPRSEVVRGLDRELGQLDPVSFATSSVAGPFAKFATSLGRISNPDLIDGPVGSGFGRRELRSEEDIRLDVLNIDDRARQFSMGLFANQVADILGVGTLDMSAEEQAEIEFYVNNGLLTAPELLEIAQQVSANSNLTPAQAVGAFAANRDNPVPGQKIQRGGSSTAQIAGAFPRIGIGI